MEKACFTGQKEYGPNGKDMVLQKIIFRIGNCHGKRWEIPYKRYNVNQS